MLRLYFIVFFYLVFNVSSVSYGAVYFVDKNNPEASDSGPGTEERPFRTITRAVNGLKPGDTVLIKAGEYRESVTIEAKGTLAKPITIQAYPGHEGKVIVKGSEVFTNWKREVGVVWSAKWKYSLDSHYPSNWPDYGLYPKHVEMVFVDRKPLQQVLAFGLLKRGSFYVDERNQRIFIALYDYSAPQKVEVAIRQRGVFVRGEYIHIKGLVVTQVANPHSEAAFEVRGKNIVLENNIVEWNNLDGFRFAGQYIFAFGNVANHNGRCGISASIHDSILKDNTTNENSWRFGPWWHAGGVKVVGGAPLGNRIIGHTAINNNGPGIWFDYGCRKNRIERSLLQNNLGAGIILEACSGENWVINNIIDHTRAYPESLNKYSTGVGLLLYEAYGTHVYHNTIVDNEQFGILIAGGVRKIHYDGSEALSKETRIFNNIIASNRVAGLGFWVWGKSASQEAISSHKSDSNLWYIPLNTAFVLSHKGERFLTLKEWQEKSRQDLKSLSINPQFDKDMGSRYWLKPTSPAIDRGIPLNEVKVDFTGKPRPEGSGPDMGAYEIQ